MILVAGGTGTLGTELVPLLSARGLGVRVLTRDPSRATHLPDTVETITGDIQDEATVTAAIQGCRTVISAVHGFAGAGKQSDKQSPESIDRDANLALIQAAVAAGVEHFVLISVQGAAPDHPMSLHRTKYAAEQALVASSLQWTIIRPTAYLETWTGIIGAKIASSGQAQVFGPGHNPNNFVSARDVATIVDLAVNDQSLRGQTVDATGENLTFTEIAERMLARSGKLGKIKRVPLPMLRMMSVLARPISPMFARQAHAAVVMNTTDMTADVDATRHRFPAMRVSTLDDVLTEQQTQLRYR